MGVRDEPKIDCHVHVLDPARFPYAPDTRYRPAGQEIAPVGQLLSVMAAHEVRHALVVGPNSGYGTDNRCLLDAIAQGADRFKGIAVVPLDIGNAELRRLAAQGVVGVAFNPALLGVEAYLGAGQLVRRLADLGLFLQLQVEKDQLLALAPLTDSAPVRLLIDHCGRPDPMQGLDQPGFQALLALGRSGRAAIKLSGYAKLSTRPHPHADAWPFIRALLEAFTLERCLWASDWPFLRAPARVDYGPLVDLVATLVPDAGQRRTLLWETPMRLFRFGGAA